MPSSCRRSTSSTSPRSPAGWRRSATSGLDQRCGDPGRRRADPLDPGAGAHAADVPGVHDARRGGAAAARRAAPTGSPTKACDLRRDHPAGPADPRGPRHPRDGPGFERGVPRSRPGGDAAAGGPQAASGPTGGPVDGPAGRPAGRPGRARRAEQRLCILTSARSRGCAARSRSTCRPRSARSSTALGDAPGGPGPAPGRLRLDAVQQQLLRAGACRPVLAERPHRLVTSDAPAPEPVAERAADTPWRSPSTCVAAHGADLRRHGQDGAGRPHANPDPARTVLEPWRPASESCIWQFNTLYWQALKQWEQAAGRAYEQALPGGRSDARNTGPVRELILELFRVWDGLAARRALPEELYVVELGVGNGNQARTWLDAFAELDRAHGARLLPAAALPDGRLLAARAGPGPADGGRAPRPRQRDRARRHPARSHAGFLQDKAFLVYISNVYDNLPTDEVASIQRPALPGRGAGLPPGRGRGRDRRPARHAAGELGRPDRPAAAAGPGAAGRGGARYLCRRGARGALWRRGVGGAAAWRSATSRCDGLDGYQVAPACTGEILRPAAGSRGDIRMHVSNGAVASFVDTLPLLHPYGLLTATTSSSPTRASTSRVPRARQVRRLGRELGQRPAARSCRATGAASTCGSRRSRARRAAPDVTHVMTARRRD